MPNRLGNTIHVSAPQWLPQLRRAAAPIKHQSLARAQPERVEVIAMLHDLCGQSLKSLGRSIGYRQARRDLDAGREVLCSDGVLPWAAYARGVLADDWWQDPALQDAVNEWIEARFTDPAEPVPSAEDRLRAATASLIDTTQIERRISLVLLGGFASGEPWRWEDPCAQPCAQPARIPAT